MTRGFTQLKLDIRSLRRSEVHVHSSALPAYRYYRDFLRSAAWDREPPSSGCPLLPILEAQVDGERLFLISGFATLERLGDVTKCAIRSVNDLNRPQIERRAWESVLAYEPFQPVAADVACAKILRLQRDLPDALAELLLPVDPDTDSGPDMKLSPLARAMGVPPSTVNNVLSLVRGGGVADVRLTDVLSNSQQGESHE